MYDRGLARALIRELNLLGAVDIRVENTRKSRRLFFWFGGQAGSYTFPATPSDGRRGRANAIAYLRRKLRGMMQ